MTGLLTLIGRHSRAMVLGSIVAVVVLFGGGLALGMGTAAGTPAPRTLDNAAAMNSVTQPSRHYLVGTIVQALAPGRAIVRGVGGRFFVVDYDRSTIVRQNRRRVPLQTLRRGTRVIILGSPRAGRLHADVVTITGVAASPRQSAIGSRRAGNA